MDFPGLKDKIIFGMGGYGGNAILIDVENSRILVLNSLHYIIENINIITKTNIRSN